MQSPKPSKRTQAKARAEKAKRQAQANKERWKKDPVAFAIEALGVTTLWEDQIKVARDVANGGRVSWRAGQKIGKSLLFACLALWKIYCFDDALVVMTSGNLTQVKAVLWREVRKRYEAAKRTLPGGIGGKIGLDPTTGLTFEDGRLLTGLTVRDADRAGGYSGADILILIDEASAVHDEIIEAFLGNIAGGGTILFAGNPIRPTGMFARTHREHLKNWKLHHTSVLNSPNVLAGKLIIPGLALPEYVEDMASDYGTESPAYVARVLGEFPLEGEDCIISLGLVDQAIANWNPKPPKSTEPLFIGVDPAGIGSNGDETAVQGITGKHAFPCVTARGLDNPEVANLALEYMRKHSHPGQEVVFRVDVGGLGQGVADFLERGAEARTYKVERINAANVSSYPERFVNMRAQQWFALRKWLERGGTIPKDQKQEGEMLRAKSVIDNKLRQGVLSKAEMKKLLRRSPDRADALCLAALGEHPLNEGEGKREYVPVVQPRSAPRPHEGRREERPITTWQPGMRFRWGRH